MSNLIDIQSQIQKLQKQAADIKAKEFGKTVSEIRDMMAAFGITVKDLQSANGKTRARKTTATTKLAKKATAKNAAKKKLNAKKSALNKGKKTKTGATVAAKYRGPGGETWSGRGLTPRWMAALVAQGRARQDFAIKA